MPLASNLTPDKRFIGLFIGPKHSGKTCAACSFTYTDVFTKEDKLVKVFDFDGRIRGLLGAPWIRRELVDYTYFPPRGAASNTSVYEAVNKECELLMINGKQYGAAIMDSLTAETFALLCDAIPQTHEKDDGKGGTRKVGKHIGAMAMPGPEDYGFEATGTYQLMAFLRSLPIQNIIVTAHVVDKFGKPINPDTGKIDPYAESVVVGEKLSIRDKIAQNTMIYFDHIFRFDRRMTMHGERFFVRFKGDLACTSYPNLPDGEVDITGKDFSKLLAEYQMPKEIANANATTQSATISK